MIEQLGLNQTYFYQLALFVVAFLVLRVTYFAPLSRLIGLRNERTTLDRAAAEKLEAQNAVRTQDYRERLGVVRAELRSDRDLQLKEVRKQESLLLSQAREEAKQVSQNASAAETAMKKKITDGLSSEVESLATSLTKKLLGER